MKTTLLSPADVLAGYDAISALYPHIPPMSAWRGWEYAGYRRHRLAGPVLDVGCGDGQVFRLLWPDVGEVVGVDMDAGTVEAARRSGVYRDVHQVPASEMDRVLPAGAFASAFANCALEHMDDLPRVLANVAAALRPGGAFLFSVVTEKWRQWGGLALLFDLAGDPARAEALRRQHDHYHHHVNNALTVQGWAGHLAAAGFEAVEHTPIVPEITGRLVSLLDQVWHLPSAESPTGEVGGRLHPVLVSLPDFPAAFRKIVEGTMQMEPDPATGGGAIFYARKRGA
jgi:SAM-dependent methyltransferase